MHIIAIYNQKGGVGKTTITMNTAAFLSAKHHKKVLVVDCDPQGNLTSYLDISGENEGKKHLYSFFNEEASLEELIQSYSYKKGTKNHMQECHIDLIPGGSETSDIDVTDTSLLREALLKLDYDYVLIDCPPSTSDIAIAVLIASDYVLVPAWPDSDSLGGYQGLIDTVNLVNSNGYPVKILGIILNNVSSVRGLDAFISSKLREGLSEDALFDAKICSSSEPAKARFFGEPLCFCAEHSKVADGYRAFVRELIKKVEG